MKKNRLVITLLIPRYQNMFSTFYTLEIIKEVSKAALAFDVDLLIETTWKAGPGAGILFADMMGNERWISKARKEKFPYLILNYYDLKSKDNCIGIDNEQASLEAVNYLLRAGHRRIATITGKLNAQAGRMRLTGFKKALEQARLAVDKRYIAAGNWTQESGAQAMKKLLRLENPPTAVFVAGDEMALGAIEAAKEKGLKVPEDISVVGFDNIAQTEFNRAAALTSVEQPFADLALLGVKNLIRVIKNKPRQPIKILLSNTKLVRNAATVRRLRAR